MLRSTSRLGLTAALFIILTCLPARAQLAAGDSVKIDAVSGSRVNVRGEPEIRDGNVVGIALGGERARILESTRQGEHIWYRLLGPNGRYEGWIRGDLIAEVPRSSLPSPSVGGPADVSVGSLLPITPDHETGVEQKRESEGASGSRGASADPAIEELQGVDTVSGASVALPDDTGVAGLPARQWPPLESRTDWTRNLATLYEPAEFCARTGSSQPARVLKAYPMARGLVNVLVQDATARDWDCIVRDTGGTPLRYDPLSATGLLRPNRTDPIYVPAASGPPEDNPCYEIELFEAPGTGKLAGWILHPRCN
ncbi:MAG: SH3 domain-containing protein [Geminicoccaceae bacterium]|nr:SH3 domain-containing protein [Geminicoccaceae bacterium]MCB9945388.1 SH3 domain-containing protein [Geminicoccaceae bacterium]